MTITKEQAIALLGGMAPPWKADTNCEVYSEADNASICMALTKDNARAIASLPDILKAYIAKCEDNERLTEAAQPLLAKLKLVEEARETWKPSSGSIGDGYTIAIKAGLLRNLRAILKESSNAG